MTFRHFIAAFMILMSLSAQARTELACGMSPAVAVTHDCCPPQVQPSDSSGIHGMPCCEQVAPSDAPLAQAVNAADASTLGPLLDASFSPVLLSSLSSLNATSIDVDRRYAVEDNSDDGRRRIRPLYLQTARLRL